MIATKADKISRGARQKQLAPICRALLVQPWEIICWSSEDGTGRDQLLTLLEKVLGAGRRSAGSLTRIFHPPHTMGTARRIRLDGGVQQ